MIETNSCVILREFLLLISGTLIFLGKSLYELRDGLIFACTNPDSEKNDLNILEEFLTKCQIRDKECF